MVVLYSGVWWIQGPSTPPKLGEYVTDGFDNKLIILTIFIHMVLYCYTVSKIFDTYFIDG